MGGRGSAPHIGLVAVLALVVVDVVLVAVILGNRSGSAPATTTAVKRVAPSTSTSPSPSPSPTDPSTSASPSPSPTPSAAASSAVTVQRVLVAVYGARAWRVSTGTCADGGASVSLTTDGGRSWKPGTAPLASISRLVARPGSDSVFAVGADGGCEAQLRRTGDGGATWADATGLDGFFYIDPRHPGSVAVPGRGTVQACGGEPVTDLAVDGRELEVLCPGGQLRSIGDGDRRWTDGPRIGGAIALTTSHVDPTRTYVARLGQSGCTGVQIVDTARLGNPLTCVRSSDPVTPASVSLSIAGTAGWLLIGDHVYNSGGTLEHWVER